MEKIQNFTKDVEYDNQWYRIKCENEDEETIKVTFMERQFFNKYDDIWFPGEFDENYRFVKYYNVTILINNLHKIYYLKEFYIGLIRWLLDDYLREKQEQNNSMMKLNELYKWDGKIDCL